MHELPHVYEQCYEKPFEPPLKVQQALMAGGAASNGKPEVMIDRIQELSNIHFLINHFYV